jgi:hypothetical protein
MHLPRFRFLLSLLFVSTLAVLPSAARADQTADPGLLQSIQDQVSQLRGLTPLGPVDMQQLDHASLRDYLVQTFQNDYLPSERERDQNELVAFGFIGPTDDIVQISLDLLTSQVLGIYDTDTKSLFVVNDQDTFGPAARITLAHEFTHALQDQYFDLDQLAPKHPANNDRALGARAVLEGDAVMLQSVWAMANLSHDELTQLATTGGGDALRAAPPIVRTELLFPYVDGLRFVSQVYQQAGGNYAAVNDLFRNPPESTAQVLHVDKYRAHVHPVDVDLPDIATALGPDWRSVGTGVLGELDTRVLLEQYGNRAVAIRVASGWSGDRWQVLDQNGRMALVFKSTWDSDASAQAFFDTYAGGLQRRFDWAHVDTQSASHAALSGPEVATDLRVTGRDVLAVISFDRPSVEAILGAMA